MLILCMSTNKFEMILHYIVLKFPVYKMETGNFMVYIIFGLHHVNLKHSCFHLIRNYPGIPVYATNFQSIPFPKWKFWSGKMETLFRPHHPDGVKDFNIAL